MCNLNNKSCQVCNSRELQLAYKCPLMPLGGQLLSVEDEFSPEVFYPLHYVICNNCSTFQSIETIPDELLESENTYISETSKQVIDRDYTVFCEIMDNMKLNDNSFVIEIGGSVGIFLNYFLNKNIQVMNIEPVKKASIISQQKGIETASTFFDKEIATSISISKGRSDLIIAKHVLELVPNLHLFIENLKIVLAKNGRVMMEVPYIKNLLKGNFYDILAHLRKYHFSMTGLNKLFEMNGLAIETVIQYSSLGGGLRFYAGWKNEITVSQSVKKLLYQEKQEGITELSFYNNLQNKGLSLKRELLRILDPIKNKNKRIAGYGAGIKASALLNFCGLDSRYLEFLVDNGKHKQGKIMPGVRLPIYSSSKIDHSIDYILLLAWLHKDEIIESLQMYVKNGGKIIIPTPEVYIVE